MTQFSQIEGGLLVAQEFVAAANASGIKPEGLDTMLLHSRLPASAAATITSNRFRAAPTFVTERHVADGSARTVIATSGNANAATGAQGMANAEMMASLAALETHVPVSEALVCSTGRIGIQLPMDRVEAGIRACGTKLSRNSAHEAARAIMTTDTFPKEVSVEFEVGGRRVGLGAICKGAGMICPNMATMLCFICTDLAISPAALRSALGCAVERSFNCISVDGDMSTNDTVIALANGASDAPMIATPDDAGYAAFAEALGFVTQDLAKKIARDGEGSSKFVTVDVTGAATYEQAHAVARAVTKYNLVKTCIWGEDFNWGRVAAAIGASGVDVDPATVQIAIGGLTAFAAGEPVEYDLDQAGTIMKSDEIEITIDLGAGQHSATNWSCDLTPTFVELNAH
jgi:glutamate N-acetyltransferase/amino-acid N-acetyltransferase